jgi:hypothetical protein
VIEGQGHMEEIEIKTVIVRVEMELRGYILKPFHLKQQK